MTGRRLGRLSHERRILLLTLAAGLAGVAATLVLLVLGDYSARARWTVGLLVVGAWLVLALETKGAVVHPLRTLTNLLGALREEDFSFRARPQRGDDALSEVLREVNALADTLRDQRLGALEATALLRTVAAEIEVAVFTFDGAERLMLLNRAAERALGRHGEQALGRTAQELGLAEALRGPTPRVLELALPGGMGRFEARHSAFRQGGRPHRLLVLADLSRALRDEERQAWQRLIRVIGHELNNSLAPIRSIAESLEALLSRAERPQDAEADLRHGLAVIRARAESLSRFMEGYARLARLPPPSPEPVALGPLARRVAGLETRLAIGVEGGPELQLLVDGDQVEQLLINLVRNAADAALESGGGVSLGWRVLGRVAEIRVLDEGPGLSSTANLFVPFFTTKPGGTGIGLVLSRQIAEAHGGSLSLQNRSDRRGCVALVRLPLAPLPRTS